MMLRDGTFYIASCPNRWDIISNLMGEIPVGCHPGDCPKVPFMLCEVKTEGLILQEAIISDISDAEVEKMIAESRRHGFFEVKVKIRALIRQNDCNNDHWKFAGQILHHRFVADINGFFTISRQCGEVQISNSHVLD